MAVGLPLVAANLIRNRGPLPCDQSGSMTTAIIFDMDGVLIDSEPLSLEATNVVLERRGARLTSADNTAYLGWNQRRYWTDLVARFGLDEEPAILIREREEALLSLMAEGLEAAPGVIDLIDALTAMGTRIALATGTSRAFVDHILARIGLTGRFEALACGDEVERPKPDPEIFLLAARRLGVRPADAIVLEDSVNGLRAARAAGMKVVRVVTETTRALDFPPVDDTIDGFPGLDAQRLVSILERSAP